MKVKLLSGDKITSGPVLFEVSDPNSALIHSFRQVAIRDVEIYAFGNIKIHKNESEYTDEMLSEEISKLKLNQTSLLNLHKNPEKVKIRLKIQSMEEFRPVYAADLQVNSESLDELFEFDNILICTLKKGQILSLDASFVLGNKKNTQNTAFLSIAAVGTQKVDNFSGILLGTLTFRELEKKVFDFLVMEYREFFTEMKKVKEEYGDKGLQFKTSRYDYVILNAICVEIHRLNPSIAYCATHQPHPLFPESLFVIYDKSGKELEILKGAADSILGRL